MVRVFQYGTIILIEIDITFWCKNNLTSKVSIATS